jgi:ferredoxin
MIHVNTKACDGCGTCVGVCPADALILEETVSVDPLKCTVCLTCVRICPFGALRDVTEDSRTAKDAL